MPAETSGMKGRATTLSAVIEEASTPSTGKFEIHNDFGK